MAIELYNDGNHICVAFQDLVECKESPQGGDACESIQANQFLIVHHEHAALLDPGGNLTYTRLFMQVSDYVAVKNLDYVIASHQDPDIVASLNKWLVGTRCKVVVPKLWERFIPHFCNPGATTGRLIGIPDVGMDLQLESIALKAIPAHFLHSEGNFHFYDPVSKILFTGDVGASMVDDSLLEKPIKDFDKHIPRMERFHQRYMASNKVCRYWANMVRELDVEMLVPQHGPSFKGKKMVERFLSWFEQLQCGVDLMTQANYRIPSP